MRKRGCASPTGKGWWLSSVLLLLLSEEKSHGYELVEKLREFGINLEGVGNIGRIYTFLNNFEEMNYVAAEWDTETSPPRKIYTITEIGLSELQNIKKEMENQKKLINDFIKRAENHL
ncbi:MAG: helix-turn-helix transcriptional regulator [Thermotogae bacterium]|nr:helix-turn-helix transcriptional regulator [Thermotogota bacterium]